MRLLVAAALAAFAGTAQAAVGLTQIPGKDEGDGVVTGRAGRCSN